MKAIAIDSYGGAEKMNPSELADPRPSVGEILVRVRAAAVNPLDWKIRSGQLRFILRLAFPYVPGTDIAGEVLEVGDQASRFKPGDSVVAFIDPKHGGAYAELAVAKERAAALKPKSLSFAEAASLPVAGCTALQALRDLGEVSKDRKVLILGGSGGVGHFAIQIARALGAKVDATCGESHVEFVRALGADRVIDYRKEDFTVGPERYDVIFDTVAASSFSACRDTLEPGGVYVTTLPSPDVLFWALVGAVVAKFRTTKKAKMIMVRPNADDLAFLARLADEGKLRPVVSEAFPLARAAEAQQVSRAGHAKGKIILECL
jgi:NADPH:quinone reductase-like Zn-dependent oxidoreductase